MLARSRLAAVSALVVALSSNTASSAPWITFTEVSYRPANPGLEFVEIYNLDAPRVDIGGWRLEGEIRYEFPPGTTLAARGCLVIAASPEALRGAHPELAAVVGPFEGKLDNDGGSIVLHDATGAIVARMRYGRDGAWSAVADGTGHTLVLTDGLYDARDARSWQASDRPGGSPGAYEKSLRAVPGEPLVRRGEPWRFLRGHAAVPSDWMEPDFDDSGWESGPSGFGFGDEDDATLLDDMRGSYATVFTRRELRIDDPESIGSLTLAVDYDDGFVAYLNGEEIARSNAGPPDSPVTADSVASGSREAGAAEPFAVAAPERLLRRGRNVLAVVGLNGDLDSSDFSLAVELEFRPPTSSQAARRLAPRLNEVALDARGGVRRLGWIELWSRDDRPMDVGGHLLSDDPTRLDKWRIPPGTELPPRGPVTISGAALGAAAITGSTLFLSAPSGKRVVDALLLRGGHEPDGDETIAYGRYPDLYGEQERLARPTPEAANELVVESPVVIHEIGYHPPSDDPLDEFIELHNRGSSSVALGGWRLRGGVRAELPEGTTLRAGGLLVVTRAPADFARRHELPESAVVGPLERELSNRGELIRLEDDRGRVVDLVRWADRSPWPEAADGGGSSLELIDAHVDNSIGTAWAASDERARSAWHQVEYTSSLYVFRDMPATSLQLLLLDAGECLVDDVRLLDADGRAIVADGFEAETTRWRAFGTHGDSGVERESAFADGPCYRIVATGRGNSRHNYVSLDLDRELDEDREYTVSFRVRWLGGCPLLLTRTSGQGLARTTRLPTPREYGTPGRPNSRAAISPPVLATPRQSPIAPRSDESVRLEVAISARDAVASAEVRYRHESGEEWQSVPMTRPVGGLWVGEIPPQPRGRVEFVIVALDAAGREGRFPPPAIEAPAQYAVDLTVAPDLPTYSVLVTDAEWRAHERRQRMSNRLMDATLVYGDSRIFYNVGFRARGSGFTRGSGNWRLAFGAETLDGRSELTFDGQGRDFAKMNERLTFWVLSQLDVPTPRQRYVRVGISGQPQESGVYEEVEKINGEYLDRWFPTPSGEATLEGILHKLDDYWDFRPPDESELADQGRGFGQRRGRFGGFGARNANYIEAYLRYDTSDPEDYRWNFPPRANQGREDFAPLLELLRLVDPEETDDREFGERVESLVAADGWTRVLAGRTVANDWDSYGLSRGKNSYLYRDRTGLWHLLPWDSDLSWRVGGFGGFGRDTGLFPEKFPAVRRLLEQPRQRRRFLRHIAFLAEKRLSAEVFDTVVSELEEVVGASGDAMRRAAQARRESLGLQLPRIELTVRSAERLSAEGRPDTLRVRGTAPLLAADLRLAGRSGSVEFPDERSFTLELSVEPEGGELELEAIDDDGDPVGRVTVLVPAAATTAQSETER